jgi:hypothetical protein
MCSLESLLVLNCDVRRVWIDAGKAAQLTRVRDDREVSHEHGQQLRGMLQQQQGILQQQQGMLQQNQELQLLLQSQQQFQDANVDQNALQLQLQLHQLQAQLAQQQLQLQLQQQLLLQQQAQPAQQQLQLQLQQQLLQQQRLCASPLVAQRHAAAVQVSGATGPNAAHINGLFRPVAGEGVGGKPVYKKVGADTWIEYWQGTEQWHLKSGSDKGKDAAWMVSRGNQKEAGVVEEVTAGWAVCDSITKVWSEQAGVRVVQQAQQAQQQLREGRWMVLSVCVQVGKSACPYMNCVSIVRV